MTTAHRHFGWQKELNQKAQTLPRSACRKAQPSEIPVVLSPSPALAVVVVVVVVVGLQWHIYDSTHHRIRGQYNMQYNIQYG